MEKYVFLNNRRRYTGKKGIFFYRDSWILVVVAALGESKIYL